ncbi:MAG: hypothetical protein ABTQ27_03660 [Amaricoccus sp.]|uniref:hypothetical protein n=1 Tax=Amaricoccus sp. TaxID=1872485 RepID=UPI0033159BFE
MAGLLSHLAGVPGTLRLARGVSLDDALTAGLVAAPFAGAAGIWISALTWWPNLLIQALTAVLWLALALWIAGFRREGEPE